MRSWPSRPSTRCPARKHKARTTVAHHTNNRKMSRQSLAGIATMKKRKNRNPTPHSLHLFRARVPRLSVRSARLPARPLRRKSGAALVRRKVARICAVLSKARRSHRWKLSCALKMTVRCRLRKKKIQVRYFSQKMATAET